MSNNTHNTVCYKLTKVVFQSQWTGRDQSSAVVDQSSAAVATVNRSSLENTVLPSLMDCKVHSNTCRIGEGCLYTQTQKCVTLYTY